MLVSWIVEFRQDINMKKRIWIGLLAACLLLGIFAGNALPQSENSKAEDERKGVALVVKGRRLITFYATVDGQTPEERARQAASVLRTLSEMPGFNIDQIHTEDGISGTNVVASGRRIATITDQDAKYVQGNNTKMLANDFVLKSKYALIDRAEQQDASALAFGVGFCVIGFLAMVFFIALICRLAILVCEISDRSLKQGIKIQDAELISARALLDMITAVIKLLQFAIIFLLVCVYVVVALRFFPATRPLADMLIESAKIPFATLAESIIVYLPNLFSLFVIAIISYGAIFLCRFFFNALRDKSIRIADFDPDWAEPTYKLARFMILFFALVCAFPYLPGSDTAAFKQVGLVLGIIVSFGSSSAISNMVAGIVLTYTNAFRIGDRVLIADQRGDVVEKNMFVTKIKTPKGEVVSIPNAPILAGSITNYSAEGLAGRLVLYTKVTIGYETPWRKVHEVLLSAAANTKHVLSDPLPFVLQTSLDDFYVTYELNVYTDQAQKMPEIYSNLHMNIQDSFFKAGLEIMSPHYTCLRDGNMPSIPQENLPEGFEAPVFRVSSAKN